MRLTNLRVRFLGGVWYANHRIVRDDWDTLRIPSVPFPIAPLPDISQHHGIPRRRSKTALFRICWGFTGGLRFSQR